jgi:hypothetical protein
MLDFIVAGDRRSDWTRPQLRRYFEDRAAMEAGWRSEAGHRATADNANCLDLERTRWSVVDEIVVRAGGGHD